MKADALVFSKNRAKQLRSLHELLLSLNIATALGYGTSLYIARSMAVEFPENDFGYYYLRGFVRFGDLLHQARVSPVSTDAVGRQDAVLWNHGLVVLAFLVTVGCAAAIIHLLLKIIGPRSGLVLRHTAGFVALFGAPVCCVGAWQLTSKWENQFSMVQAPFGRSLLIAVLATELVVTFILMSRKHPLAASWSSTLLFTHFAFWSVILFPNFVFYIGMSQSRALIHFVAWVIPSVGAASLLYVWPGSAIALPGRSRIGIWSVIPAFVGLAALLATWLPAGSQPPLLNGDAGTIIELSRGPCFGACPVYNVTVHSDGNVEFDGRENVRVKGTQTSQITSAQFSEILNILRRVSFWDLEDRAFSWCFDTPSVAITVKANGREKRVTSDSDCIPKRGRQTDFVRATDQIETIIGTDRWVLCDGRRCR
ncbi:MAG TPA: DUF6438 domain-containing protein [Dongiaceae bacterium]|nr:DUF6438 domain-containing protein [Dongiaceae bacterium]